MDGVFDPMKSFKMQVPDEEMVRWKEEAAAAGVSLAELVRRRMGQDDSAFEPPVLEASSVELPREARVGDVEVVPLPEKPPRQKKGTLCPRCERFGAPSCPACRASNPPESPIIRRKVDD